MIAHEQKDKFLLLFSVISLEETLCDSFAIGTGSGLEEAPFKSWEENGKYAERRYPVTPHPGYRYPMCSRICDHRNPLVHQLVCTRKGNLRNDPQQICVIHGPRLSFPLQALS